jgi:lactate dehydrogenase-like 2-hydroxyacid dehydrogenase
MDPDMKPKVVYTADIPPVILGKLREKYDLTRHDMRRLSLDKFLAAIEKPDAIITCPGDKFAAAAINALPSSVKLLASYSVGLDHVDLDAAARKGIKVTSTPDVLTEATADIAILLILGVMRGIGLAQTLVTSQTWEGWSPNQIFGYDLGGKTLGILGGGRIGAATAKRAKVLGMKLTYHSRNPSEPLEALGASYIPVLDHFWETCELLSLHLPLTSETHHIVNTNTLARMKPGSMIVNTARGGLIDDNALIRAASQGHIVGIGLDVYADEPRIHPGYLTLRNAFLLPHMGSATHETREAMGMAVLQSLHANIQEPASQAFD